jgi:hypothetical protein
MLTAQHSVAEVYGAVDAIIANRQIIDTSGHHIAGIGRTCVVIVALIIYLVTLAGSGIT